MTNWEIGQDLIAISDYIDEKLEDITNSGNDELALELERIQAQVGDLFNKYNDHCFGIFDSSWLDGESKGEER